MLVLGGGEVDSASNHVLPLLEEPLLEEDLLDFRDLLDHLDLNETAAIKDDVGRWKSLKPSSSPTKPSSLSFVLMLGRKLYVFSYCEASNYFRI